MRRVSPVASGLDVLLARAPDPFGGARVGILSHQASVDSRCRHIIELLHARRVRVCALFAPEHGLWGTAQDQIPVGNQKDSALQIPIFSLYGDRRVPTAEQLAGIDILVCDLQDVGSRYYTFIWTLALALQACARHQKKIIVLDRPNPLGGGAPEGPVLDPRFASFVGLYPLPARHGMTIGEIARWMNGALGVGADLEVVPMRGWRRAMDFESTGLPWVLPSPNMPTVDTAWVYPGACLVEGTNLSEGRGTTRPFELIGAPYVNAEPLARLLNAEALPGVHFRPCYFEPTFHKYARQLCGGVQIHVTNRRIFKPFLTGTALIKRVFDLHRPFFAWRDPPYEYEKEKWPFDILCGTDQVRQAIENGKPLGALEKSWLASLKTF